ncbi:MAG: hypothetical protein GF330_10465 [Candidatus Eisenbacteria bacterium]|nr:hypothetical protein [Candidatus Eisenbacteria bacterium]
MFLSSLRVTVLSLSHLGEEGFDAEPLESFCREHEVTAWRDHFFVCRGRPHLAVILEYRSRDSDRGSQPGQRRGPERERRADQRNYRKELEPTDRLLYDRLREWRALRSSRDGVPVYVIFNNRQLAEIARHKPCSKSALREIDGVGEAKVGKYAEDIFALLSGAAEASEEPDGSAESKERAEPEAEPQTPGQGVS